MVELTNTPVSNQTTYKNLLEILSGFNFPSLETLHLRGWLDATSVRTVLSSASAREIARNYLPVFGLLAYLHSSTITEVRLEDSRGHQDSGVLCIFERRQQEQEHMWGWESRLVMVW